MSAIPWRISTKFKEFCKHSSLHGFYYFYMSKSWKVHMVWGCILLASLVLCSFLGNMIWNKYNVDPTLIVVESTRYPIKDVKFPAVTLCSKKFVYGPNTENITRILNSHGYNLKEIHEFYRSINRISSNEYVAPMFVNKMHTLFNSVGISFLDLILTVKKPCADLLVSCSWRSKSYNCHLMFNNILTVFGVCCKFDMHYFSSNIKHKDNITFISDSEIDESLVVVIDGRFVSPNGTISNGSVAMYITEDSKRMTLLHNELILTASTFYDVSVDVWLIDSSPNVESLSLASRKCFLNTEKTGISNFYRGCISEFILKSAVVSCHCLPFNYTAAQLQVTDHKPCTWDLMRCVFSSINKSMSEIKTFTSQSECYGRCNYVQYETDVKYLKQTRQQTDYYTTLAVHFTEQSCIKYRRQVLYTWDQMLANLGGIFGLCVGGSIISIIELMWFIVDALYIMVTGPKQNKVVTKKRITQKLCDTTIAPRTSTKNNHKLAFVN